MDFLLLIGFFILGMIFGTFGVVQILIVLLYSLTTNRKLHKMGFLRDPKRANSDDMLTVYVVGTLIVVISWLVFRYASGNHQNLYIGTIFLMLIIGRKQLKGNQNNIEDYLKSHSRFISFEEKDVEMIDAILDGRTMDNWKQGIVGFLLLYLLGVVLFVLRAGYITLTAVTVLVDSESMTYLTSLNNNFGIIYMLNMVMFGLSAAIGLYLIYSMITKNSKTPKLARVFHIVIVATSTASFLLLGLTPSYIAEWTESYLNDLIITAVPALWGEIYFSKSSRVSATFGSAKIGLDTNTAIK